MEQYSLNLQDSQDDAEVYLNFLCGGSLATFQTFDDIEKRKDPFLSRVLHGKTKANIKKLHNLQKRGAGIFSMVNEGDGKGRSAKNVIKVRAVFVDLDGAPIEPVLQYSPHLIVESSPGRYHAFWLVKNFPLEQFGSIQKALAKKFNGDPSVHDLSRVMRVPGFLHQKREPFRTKILHIDKSAEPAGAGELISQLGLDLSVEVKVKLPLRDVVNGINQGGRNTSLAQLAGKLIGSGFGLEETLQLCLSWNQQNEPPLSNNEVEQTVRSIFARESSKQILLQKTQQQWPASLDPEAMPGLLGEFVVAATSQSEAVPVAVLIAFLTYFAIHCGNSAYLMIGDTRHYARINAVIVGETSKGRKGTSLGPVIRVFKKVKNGCRTSPGPLSSGEGIVYAVRDERLKWNKKLSCMDVADPGVKDKRIIVSEEEFSAQLQAAKRDGNTLSSVIRTLFDNGDSDPLTKSVKDKCTGAHVGIIAHITLFELDALLTQNDKLNGFGNRFLWICSRREKMVPFPKPVPEEFVTKIVNHLDIVIATARDGGCYEMSSSATELWGDIYPELSEATDGIAGAMTSRAEAYVLRLAFVYCLFRGEKSIDSEDLKAALALWSYAYQSAQYIFDGQGTYDQQKQKILECIGVSEKTTTEIRKEAFANHIDSSVLASKLKELVKDEILVEEKVSTAGAPKTLYQKHPHILSALREITPELS